MTQYYDEYTPTYEDRAWWSSPRVLRDRAARHPHRIYLDVPWAGESYTFAETLDLAERVGSGMLAAGAQTGDRVLVMIPNCSAYILAWLGSSVAGLVEVPINTAYRGSFLAHQVRTTEPVLAVIAPEFVERIVDVGDAVTSIRHYFVVGEDAEVAAGISQLAAAGYEASPWTSLVNAAKTELPDVEARELGSIFFTSGTTGLSKGVMMPHAHMHLFADQCVSLTRLTEADTYMSVGPLFHGNSQFLAAYPALIAGARYVLHERFSASEWIEQIRAARATVTNFVGVMMDFVWQQEPRPDDAANDLRCIFAAPTASSILDQFKERFGVEAFVEVFGLTETCMPILTPYGVERPPGAAGLLNADWFDIRLVHSDTDEEVPVGEVGELIVRGRYPWTTCQGYFGMPDKTTDAFRNLWFHTGDGLRRDDDGWYYFVDRLKDAIRRRGENISSYEVEQGLVSHPALAEVAAIGVPADQEAGEDEVMVFLVPEPGAEISAEEIWEYADKQLPSFAVPRYLRVVDELPKTPSEKVRKMVLREQGVDGETHDRGPQQRRRRGRKG
ncbi:AMP-binding protein [Candidatus Poriferisocius sp.]|uniref:AMP-binding protein n=1 Tax=Candidatus Poriferisocius sp. TaxID=3101276 RepID=UPI003B5222CB